MNNFLRRSMLLALALSALAQLTVTAQERATFKSSPPLANLLKSDGTLNLNTGFSGSLDADGWQLVTSQNGQPRFVRANAMGKARLLSLPGGENWNDRFGDLPGVNGPVWAIAISGSEVYMSGEFT